MAKKTAALDKVGFFILFVVGLILFVAMILQGKDIALTNPAGLIAREQYRAMVVAVGIMLLIAIPSLTAFYFVAWKYRATNAKAIYDSDVRHGKLFVLSLWGIPTLFMIVLATFMWSVTHKYVPQQAIASDEKPLTIQVIALRWKWLFIYPEQNIATVNFVQVPTDTPLRFELTADEAPMSSFWIPHFGGQLYAMTGHVNPLNLLAEDAGDYTGSSAEINGAGFAGMKFTARASSKESFELWAQQAQRSAMRLDSDNYEELLRPSENAPVVFYSGIQDNLYNSVVMKYMGGHQHNPATREAPH